MNAITAVWYRFEGTGAPVWYIVEANAYSTGRNFTGSVYEYSAANPTSPGWQRTVNSAPIGSIVINFDGLDSPARVDATVNGANLAFSLQRLRWQRSAWPASSTPLENGR